MRVFCGCPSNIATGGTEVIYQFCHQLNQLGVESYIVYDDAVQVSCPTPDSFLKYEAQYVSEYIDAPDSVLVLPETGVHNCGICKKGVIMIWWLSVDFYKSTYRSMRKTGDWDIFGLKQKNNVVHFAQSCYANEFVRTELGIEECYMLGDYINDAIVSTAEKCSQNGTRENIGLYNPKKGLEKLSPILQQCRKDIQWVALSGFTPEQMGELMCRAKVYVDFGYHPGKDRIPREAAVCGCCVVTNREGSAAYREDVPVPERYKIEDPSKIEAVLDIIYELVDSYESRRSEYEAYRSRILGEKQEFVEQVCWAASILQKRSEERMVQYPFVIKGDYADNYASLENAGQMLVSLFSQSSEQMKAQCVAGAMQKMYQADYLVRILRESMYQQMKDMVTTRED